eukprot:3774483-Amphidinium_carterae.1
MHTLPRDTIEVDYTVHHLQPTKAYVSPEQRCGTQILSERIMTITLVRRGMVKWKHGKTHPSR